MWVDHTLNRCISNQYSSWLLNATMINNNSEILMCSEYWGGPGCSNSNSYSNCWTGKSFNPDNIEAYETYVTLSTEVNPPIYNPDKHEFLVKQ